MKRLITPPKNPKEGDMAEDALTGNKMFFRFGKWKTLTDEECEEKKGNDERMGFSNSCLNI